MRFIDLSIECGASLKVIWATHVPVAFCLSKLDCHGPSAPAIPTSFRVPDLLIDLGLRLQGQPCLWRLLWR